MSDPIKQTVGVPQGDKLSPLLFAIYIADLVGYLSAGGSSSIFYADEQALCSDSLENLQKSLHLLESFCNQNYLKVNVKKTKVMKFHRGQVEQL